MNKTQNVEDYNILTKKGNCYIPFKFLILYVYKIYKIFCRDIFICMFCFVKLNRINSDVVYLYNY